MIHKKLLSLLVLLMTAASGAWAEEVTVTFTQDDLYGNGTVVKDGVTLTPGNNRAHNGAKFYDYGSNTFSVDKGTFTKIEIVSTYGNISGWQREQTGSIHPDPVYDPGYSEDLYTLTWTGEAESVTFTADVYEIQSIVFTINKPDVDVNTDKTTGETTFTEAWFTMPTFDATVSYDIVRDMNDATSPVEFSGISQKQKVVVKIGEGGNYQPLTALTIQLIDPLAATDAQNIIEAEGITINVLTGTESDGTITYDETDPIPYDDFKDNMAPGLYKIVAVPTNPATSPYTGTASLEFETLTGYPVDVPAGEYVTYYQDEPLYADATTSADAVLYTITSVSDDKAVLSSAIATAHSNTPLLIYNSGSEDKTFLLIPATTEPEEVTFASEFKGTLTGETIAASTDGLNNYAFNGKKFVWVMNALEIGANKAWLAISATSGARVINLVFDDATRIDGVTRTIDMSGDYYDLNGRKLQGIPTRKGVYIQNGKKVVVK